MILAGIDVNIDVKQAPKRICKDRFVGTRKDINRSDYGRRTISRLVDIEK